MIEKGKGEKSKEIMPRLSDFSFVSIKSAIFRKTLVGIMKIGHLAA